jgi:hypothetical protein
MRRRAGYFLAAQAPHFLAPQAPHFLAAQAPAVAPEQRARQPLAAQPDNAAAVTTAAASVRDRSKARRFMEIS